MGIQGPLVGGPFGSEKNSDNCPFLDHCMSEDKIV